MKCINHLTHTDSETFPSCPLLCALCLLGFSVPCILCIPGQAIPTDRHQIPHKADEMGQTPKPGFGKSVDGVRVGGGVWLWVPFHVYCKEWI